MRDEPIEDSTNLPDPDALAANDSAVEAMGNDELKVIAAELVTQVRKSLTIDWTLRESARAKIKVMVKRIEIRSLPTLTHCFPRSFTFYVVHPLHSILRKHGYPPDLEEEATKTVLVSKPNCSAPIGQRSNERPCRLSGGSGHGAAVFLLFGRDC